jgi:hypothetical protein
LSGDTNVLRIRYQEECTSTTEAEWPEGDEPEDLAGFIDIPGGSSGSSEGWSGSDRSISNSEVNSIVNDDCQEFAGSNVELQQDLHGLGVPGYSDFGQLPG